MNQNPRQNWFEQHPRKAKWLIFLICFMFVEVACRILVFAGLLRHEIYPTTEAPTYWAYIDPVVGMWHPPDTSAHHVTDCVDKFYTTNSAGARDAERAIESTAKRRVVVLGDSMVEGYGLDRSDRVTDLLEERTGIEHLNFGTGGSFGTVQEWLYYREYASKYDHSEVFVFVLPANDFDDNDVGEFNQKLYRPYLRETDGSYEVYYPVEFDERNMSVRPLSKVIKNTIRNNVYVLNALRLGIDVFKENLTQGKPLETAKEARSYDNYSQEDLRMMKFALNRISELAGERTVYLFTIPIEADVELVQREGYPAELVEELSAFANERNNVQYLDLLPYFVEYAETNAVGFRDFSLGCDPHWGKLGSEVAAQAVYDFVYVE